MALKSAPELTAPASWRTVDFISDLHLHAGDTATFAAWRHYLQTTAADAVFMLGDVFDVWVGDDAIGPVTDPAAQAPVLTSFEANCAAVLRLASRRLALFFMHGNRDFLVGAPLPSGSVSTCTLMEAGGLTLLADPTLLIFAGQRWLLSHGDALCLADTDYLAFRKQVRSPDWQREFLARPLASRREIARDLRSQSQAQQAARERAALPWADVDRAATLAALAAAGSQTLIHGHTHRPARHELGDGCVRLVLSDWDLSPQAAVPRGDVLRLTGDGKAERLQLPALQSLPAL